MAGVKGRSGGSRPGTGGARPGSGRKPREPVLIDSQALLTTDPIKFLTALMNDVEADIKIRADAAKALLPFVHAKKGEGGKKETRLEEARKVASKFAPSAPPRLIAAGGKKV